MKRHLFLLRHGKAAWPEGVADHERPLAGRGWTTVPMVAEGLRWMVPNIELAVVSTARRTQETFEALSSIVAGIPKRDEPKIYEARPSTLLGLVNGLPKDLNAVLIVGHNPGLHELALMLAGPSSDGDALDRLERKLPTAGLMHFEFVCEWAEIDEGLGRLAHFLTPSVLGGVDED
ncbi:MAG: histidine phosphatase family protein [Proteobacteria bacterium]|nr:histidine phosphatase family protein [Pseudomonadota bacterium]